MTRESRLKLGNNVESDILECINISIKLFKPTYILECPLRKGLNYTVKNIFVDSTLSTLIFDFWLFYPVPSCLWPGQLNLEHKEYE